MWRRLDLNANSIYRRSETATETSVCELCGPGGIRNKGQSGAEVRFFLSSSNKKVPHYKIMSKQEQAREKVNDPVIFSPFPTVLFRTHFHKALCGSTACY